MSEGRLFRPSGDPLYPVEPSQSFDDASPNHGRATPRRLSEVLAALGEVPEERVSFESILDLLGDRAFAMLVVLLGLPNILPMPPPIPAICALLLVLVAIQIAVRREEPWFPGPILRGRIASADLRKAVGRALPIVDALERWTRPRLQLVGDRAGAIIGAALLITMALGMLTAAPFVGQVPYGIAVSLIGLGQMERDGAFILLGLAMGLLGAALSAGFIYGVWVAVEKMFF